MCKQIHNYYIKRYLTFCKEMQGEFGGNPDLPVEALDTNPNYIKAIVTKQLIENAWVTYNQNWCIVKNDTVQPFLTSDNPVAILYSGMVRDSMIRFLPITPRLCLSVHYNKHIQPQLEFVQGFIDRFLNQKSGK